MIRFMKGSSLGSLVLLLGFGIFGCSESADTGKGPPKGGGGGGNMMGEKMKEMTKKYGSSSGDQTDKDKDKAEEKDGAKDKDKAQDKTKEKDKAKDGDKNK